MELKIRKAEKSDFNAVLELIKGLAAYERASEMVTNTVELMETESDYFGCYVAETVEGEIIGMALYFFAYYTWVGKSLYLDDLYVKEEYRKQNIGADLLNKVFEVARQERCKRVRWQVLDWNEPAISFYKKRGALIESEWLNCTFDEEGIKNFNPNLQSFRAQQ